MWHSHEDALLQAHNTVVQVGLDKNRREAKEVAMAEEGITNDNDVTVHIPISFDGTWSKRGYTANHGIGFVISAANGKVLDYEIISKVCNACTRKKASLSEQDFSLWFENHNCVGNFWGSSPSMEMECAKRLWARSQDSSLRYKYMISNDSPSLTVQSVTTMEHVTLATIMNHCSQQVRDSENGKLLRSMSSGKMIT